MSITMDGISLGAYMQVMQHTRMYEIAGPAGMHASRSITIEDHRW